MRPFTLALASASALLSTALGQSFGPEEALRTSGDVYVDAEAVDIDGDGDLDLLAGGGLNALPCGWIENLGQGQFGARFAVDADGAQPAQSLASGDLDGDGDLDVVVARIIQQTFSGTVSWYENEGGGSFGDERLIQTIGRPACVKVADLDGDGSPEVICCDVDNGLSWFANEGNGVFGPRQLVDASAAFADFVDVVDLDEDGRLDLVWAWETVPRVFWAKNLDGDTFGAPREIGGEIFAPFSLAHGDMDGDGDTDLVVGGGNAWYWIETTAPLQFAVREELARPMTGGLTVEVGDLNGDGLLDILATGTFSDSFLWQANQGGGSFAAPTALGGAGAFSGQVLAADLDGNGDLDAAHVARDLFWFQNQGAGSFSAIQDLSRDPAGRPMDVDGDGDADLLGARDSIVWLSENLGNGTFGPSTPLIDQLPGVSEALLLDADADGDMDIVTLSRLQDQAVIQLLERTPAGFSPPVQLYSTDAVGLQRLELAAMDADGDRDVLLTHGFGNLFPSERITWLRNDGAAGLTVQPTQTLFGSDEWLWADLDGDGSADRVEIDRAATDRLIWRRNRGNGVLDTVLTLSILGLDDERPFALGDLDGDGDQDIVLYYFGSNPGIHWCENLGGGSFGVRDFLRVLPGRATEVATGDIDLDGDDDILVWGNSSTWGSPNGRWIEALGAGAFGPVRELGPGPSSSSTGFAVAVDLDGDMDLDLFKNGSDGPVIRFNESSAGLAYCGPAVPNSTGAPAVISASGSTRAPLNDLELIASDLPPQAFGYFLTGDQPGAVPMAGGSQGTLCVGGTVGRLNRGLSEIFQASVSGVAGLTLDLQDIPTPTGSTAIQSGETRYFTAWYRDANPALTSNFTNGMQVRFR